MAARSAECAIDFAEPAPPSPTSGCSGPKINPGTGLSTDYLNHFTEAAMLLEMAGVTPECLDDLDGWQPKTYAEHFATSRFSNRKAIVAAYHAADPAVGAELDRIAETLNALVMRNRERMRKRLGTPGAEAFALRVADRLRPLIARAAAVINGTTAEAVDQRGTQAAIDAMFSQ
jgi:hypothetical protein